MESGPSERNSNQDSLRLLPVRERVSRETHVISCEEIWHFEE